MKKPYWQKLFWIFVASSLLFSIVVSGLLSFPLQLSLPTEEQTMGFLIHLIDIGPLFLGFGTFLFVCVFLYLRAFVTAGHFLLHLFHPKAPLAKAGAPIPSPHAITGKQKALFDLAHTKNPYLQSIRQALNPLLLNTTVKGEKENTLTELTFSDIVDKVLYQSQTRYPKLKISLDLKADIKVAFFADMLFQALWELLKNAQQVSPSDEAIRIRTYNKGSNWFCCEMEDKGPGMDRELMEKASQLYWTTKAGSTGLGLAFVQSALSRIGGIMKLKSPKAGGLKVLLFIPKDYLFHVQSLTPQMEKPHESKTPQV